MELVEVSWTGEGFCLNPMPYLDALPSFVSQLPPGALAWATDTEHYNFTGSHGVKNLRFRSLTTDASGTTSLRFDPGPWTHDSGLTVTYSHVQSLTLDDRSIGLSAEPGSPGFGDALADEVVPVEGGCVHEWALIGRSIRIEAADLTVTWGSIDQPDTVEHTSASQSTTWCSNAQT